jgi:hypothetical protein
MRLRLGGAAVLLFFLSFPLVGQELEPAAYKVVPINVNLFQVGYILAVGDVSFTPTLPAEDVEATINSMTVMLGRSLGIFGRSANLGFVLPVTVGHLEGLYIGEFTEVDRSGLRDPMFRLAVNLYGGPAMELKEFASYKLQAEDQGWSQPPNPGTAGAIRFQQDHQFGHQPMVLQAGDRRDQGPG